MGSGKSRILMCTSNREWLHSIWATLLFVYGVQILCLICCMRAIVRPFLRDGILITIMRLKVAL